MKPGCPIVWSINSPTEIIFALVDFYLQLVVQKLPYHIKESFHFLEVLKYICLLQNKPFLLALHRCNLDTQFDSKSGTTWNREALLFTATSTFHPIPGFYSEIRFLLTRNAFQFGGEFFLQIGVTAVGIRMVPSYASLFMDFLNPRLSF